MKLPTHTIDGDYIKEWLVLGPFFPNDLETDFLTDAGGEANIQPQEGDTVRWFTKSKPPEVLATSATEASIAEGRELTWKRYQTQGNIINLSKAVSYANNATVYAACVLQSQTPNDAQIIIGIGGSIAVWINGQRVYSNPGDDPIVLDRHLFEVKLKSGANLCLVKVSQEGNSRFGFGMRVKMLPKNRVVISGIITDEMGTIIPDASVRVEQEGLEIARTQTDTSGNYQMNVYPVHGRYALSATSGILGDWQLGIQLQEGERRKVNLQLKPAISISGTLMTPDEVHSLMAVPVEAVIPSSVASHESDDSDGALVANDVPQVIATTLSDEKGQYQFINLKPGKYQLRCQILDGHVYYRSTTNDNGMEEWTDGREEMGEKEGFVSHDIQCGKILHVERGKRLEGIDFRLTPFKKGTWKTYGPLDGLGGNSITAIHGGPDGMIWFGTWGGGVSRYDGKKFVTFTTKDGLPDNRVTAVYGTPDGVMWFATEGGIARYDGKRFVTFTQKDGLRDNRVTAICSAQNGVMWFGTCGGVTRYDGKQSPPLEKGGKGGFINFTDEDGLAHYFVSTVHSTPDGVMWFGTSGGGVTRYDGKQFPPLEKGGKGGFTTFTTRDGLVSNWIFAIHSSPDGVMWFGTLNGISRYDGKQFISFTTRDGLAENRTHAIYQETDGMMWFGTGNWRGDGGISRYDGKRFINFTTRDGLADSWGTAIYQDDDGVMWFGTRHGGVSRYDGRSFVTLTTEDGLAGNRVKVIHCAHDGAMWFGTLRNGVSRYDGKQFINFTTKDGLPHNEVWAIHSSPDGIIWFGTRGGISRYDGKTFVNFTEEDGLSENEINVIYRAPDGVMWFGTQGGGVSRYDGRAFVNFTMKDGLPDNRVHAIYRDTDGVMWFGTDLGVCRYDGKAFVTLTKEDGLAEDWVTAIYRDKDGVMWFGTAEGGVSRYDGKEFPPKDLPQAERRRASSGGKGGFVNFTKEDGLADHWVSAIYQDSSGVMCFATLGGGVSQYDGVAWTSLDTRDGLASNTVHSIYAVHEVTAERSEQDSDGFDTPSATQPKGFIWFGTEGGITRYRRSRVPPIIRIIAVTTDRRYTDLDELVPAVVGTRITFEYDSIDFKTHPEKRLYRYKLDGYEADWNPPTRETQVDYAELPIGEYTFHVQAIDRDLNYSEPATVQLTVQPDSRDFMVAALQTEVDRLRREVGRKYYFTNIVGSSAPMKQVYALMGKAIDSGLTVLISGETGTGKELVAKAIHYSSPRKDQPLCELNCGAVPKELVASILFGYREGAFTGATKDTTGLFESASGGTILLDEIGSMSEEAQLHLLRVLQEHKIQRIGETHLRDVDVRVIAITNQDLAAEVRSGRFREDLYYRLNVFPIHLPALRDRLDDIPLLAEHFLQKACQEYQKSIDSFGAGVIEMLQSYNWPGNVRELESEIYRAAAFVEEGLPIHTYHFSSQITRGESLIREVLSERVSYSASLERFRRRLVEEALRECGGNRSEAARMLGMQRPNLVALIKRLGIEENSGSKD